jgi:type I restriction enzyme, S subunit
MENKITQKNIPEGWEKVNLGEISKIYDGTHQTPDYAEQGVPFYSVEHITSNNFTDTKYISESVYQKESKRVKIEKGDVLMSRIGDIGTAKYIDREVKASFYVTLALIKCSNKVNGKFLAFLINSAEFKREIWRKTIHVAFPNKINLGDISTCESIVPPFLEQNRIVAVLEVWDWTIEKLKRKIEVKKEIKKGLMQELLNGKRKLSGCKSDWSKYELEKILGLSSEKYNPHIDKEIYNCIELEHLQKEEPRLLGFVESNKQKSVKNIFYPGNILFGKLRPYLRKFLLPDFIGVCSTEIWVMKPTNLIDHTYAFYLTQTEKFINVANVSSGTHMPRADWSYMKGVSFTIPESLKEQKAIANILNTCDSEINILQYKLEKLEDQKKYLINNLVTGTIRAPESLSIPK